MKCLSSELIPETVTAVTLPALEALDHLIEITESKHGRSTYSPVNSINILFSLPWNVYGPDQVNDSIRHIEKLLKGDPPLVEREAAEMLYKALSDMMPVYMKLVGMSSLSFRNTEEKTA